MNETRRERERDHDRERESWRTKERERKGQTDRHVDKYSEEECVQRGVRNNGIVCYGGWGESVIVFSERERE